MTTGHAEEPSGAAGRSQTNTAGTVYAVQNGNQIIYHYHDGAALYRVEPLPAAPEVTAATARQLPPSWLLAASKQVVPFWGRTEELRAMTAWRDEPGRGLSVRLVHGNGGQGKTRLATRFAEASADAGWAVAIAQHHSDPLAAGDAVQHIEVPGPGLLLIVDYAERWPTGELIAFLRQHQRAAATPLRVLLLARPAGEWWGSLSYQLHRLDLETDAIPLPALAEGSVDRAAVFTAARDRFADLYELADPAAAAAPPDLDDKDYELVLAIHMAALAAVDAAARGQQPPTAEGMAGLVVYLLGREDAHWKALHDNGKGPVPTSPVTMGQAVYTATLTRALPYHDAVDVLRRVRIASTDDTCAQILADHSRCYPPTDPSLVLEPLYPDRLGEDFLALATPGHLHDYHPDPWAANAPALLLAPTRDHGQMPSYTAAAITTLIEVADRWDHLAREHLYPLLRRHPDLAITAGGAALVRLANLLAEHATDPINDRASLIAVLQAVESRLPLGRHFDLEPGAAAITRALVSLTDPSTTDLATVTNLRDMLSRRLVYAGYYDEALAPAREVAEGYRRLAETDPERYLPMLAAALDSLSQRLAERSRHQEALAPAREAADMFRRLADADPARYRAFLAGCLNNLNMLLGDLGHHEEALRVAEEAVDLARGLVETEPRLLAGILHHLEGHLATLGRHEEALAASEEGVTIQRRLAGDDPAAQPRLASMLSSLGLNLRKQGRLDEALQAATEAVALSRELVAISPAVQEPGLAMTLFNLSLVLSDLGRHEAALEAAQESSALHQRLAEADPAVYLPRLAPSLSRPGQLLESLGRREEALATAQEAVAIHRRLADVNPAAYQPGLADSLTHLGAELSDWGRRSEALALSREGVDLYRRIAKALPGVPTGLAFALFGFAWVRSRVGRELRLGLAAIQESIALYEQLAELRPDIFRAQLWSAYHIRADLLNKLGRAAEAAAIRRQLAASFSNTGPGDGQQ